MLEDGKVFRGNAIGKTGTTTGEICFNTGMTGYQEIFTDPSYFGQIMVMTNSHIGNYGVLEEENESYQAMIAGLVCRNFSEVYSRPAADNSLQNFLENDNVVGISDIDTRALVRYIRSKGTMNAIISSEIFDTDQLAQKLSEVPSMEGLELSSRVTVNEPYFWGDGDSPFRVAALDLGVKRNSLREMAERGCYVKVFPMNTTFEEMMEWNPDGFFISNGPGDPAVMPETVETVQKMIESQYPTFGICLGHQMISRAIGLPTFKMHHGHRGINHPVKYILTGHCEITSQNHGFAVSMDEAKNHEQAEITHVHLNDGTLAGLRIKGKPVFGVQYHPEAAPGPHDSRYLFDQFIEHLTVARESRATTTSNN